MNLRTRLIPVASLVVALGASAAGAAAAADSGAKPTKPGSTPVVKCDKPATPDDKAKADKAKDIKAKEDKGKAGGKVEQKDEPDWAAIAKQLGTTADKLQEDLMNTKIWLGQQTGQPTPAAFLQHVADLLHQPVAKVTTVLDNAGVFRDSTDKPGKDGKDGKKDGKDQGKDGKGDKVGKTDTTKTLKTINGGKDGKGGKPAKIDQKPEKDADPVQCQA